jgi:prevent-host-death family protein
MGAQPEISQRDLQTNTGDILDALEAGQAFTITRDGREIGALVPAQHPRRFVKRADFAQASHNYSAIELAAFRADQDVVADHVEER